MSTNFLRKISNFAVKTEYKHLPKHVVKQAKNCILDYAGVVLAGYNLSESGRIIEGLCRALGSSEESSVIGSGKKLPSTFAALVNGTMGCTVELSDGSTVAKSHPGITTIPGVMAIAERDELSGKDVLVAVVMGYEANIRLGEVIGTPALGRGFDPAACTLGPFGEACAVGKLLGLNEEQMSNAFGTIALGPMAPNEVFYEGGMVKESCMGWSAMVGTFAALLAQRGFTGPDTILEGAQGLAHCMAPSEYDFEKASKDFGEKYEIMGIYFKRHACCRSLHNTIDAVLHIREGYEISPENVKSITVRTNNNDSRLKKHKIENAVQARFSIPYVDAVALIKGRVGVGDFSVDTLKNPRVLELAKKVKVLADPEMERLYKKEKKRACTVEIELNTGESYSHHIDYPKGEPEKPFTNEELEQKFRTLAALTLKEEKIDKIVKIVQQLETLDKINHLIKNLS